MFSIIQHCIHRIGSCRSASLPRPPKACGPDGIPSRLLLELADEIAPSLSILLNMSLSHDVVPCQWKLANLTPVFKADYPTLSSNYRPISVLCVLVKVLERCIHNHSYQHLAPLIYDRSTIVDTVSSGVNQQQHNCWRYSLPRHHGICC